MNQRKKILIVVTNHDRLNNGKPTGYWLGEITHFYHILVDAGFEVDFTSPQGHLPPMDQRSYNQRDRDNQRFLLNPDLKQQLDTAIAITEVNPTAYSVIYYAGGHGAMWDFPNNQALAQVATAIYENGGIVSAVCHGSAGLLNITLSNGHYLLENKCATGFANLEERLIRLTGAVPFLLEDEMKKRGALYKSALIPFIPYVQVSDRLVTGQNPQSAKAVAQAVLRLLRSRA